MDKNLTTTQKKYLRGLAHGLDPIVLVGKKGLTPELCSAVDEALKDHELIKIKFNDFKKDKKELIELLAQKTESVLVGLVGNIAIFYRKQKDKRKRKIEIPGEIF